MVSSELVAFVVTVSLPTKLLLKSTKDLLNVATQAIDLQHLVFAQFDGLGSQEEVTPSSVTRLKPPTYCPAEGSLILGKSNNPAASERSPRHLSPNSPYPTRPRTAQSTAQAPPPRLVKCCCGRTYIRSFPSSSRWNSSAKQAKRLGMVREVQPAMQT